MKAGTKKPLFSPVSGVVIISGAYGAYGKCVRIIGDAGIGESKSEFTLGHFDQINPEITSGVHVRMGQNLGMMGKTGDATGVHVHIQLRLLDQNGFMLNANNGFKGSVDPLPYMLMWEHNNESPLLIYP